VLASAALGLSFFSGFAQPGYARTINSRAHPQHDEKDVYEVALQFIRAVPRLSERPGVIRFWYSDEPPSNPMWSVQSTFLWGYSRLHAEGRGIPDLGEEELALVRAPDLKWLTLLAERPEQIELARAALTAHGVRYQTSMQRVLSAGDYRLYVEFLELRPAS
jgi:hypothetical protein